MGTPVIDTTVAIIGIVLNFFATIITVWVIISKKNESFKKSVEDQFTEVNKSINKMAIDINTILVGDVRELRARVVLLENGQNEWTKTLRQRTHDLAGNIQTLQLEVALIKEVAKSKEANAS